MVTKKSQTRGNRRHSKREYDIRIISDDSIYFTKQSSVDQLLGRHTSSFIVAILFIITIISFLVYFLSFKNNLSNTITTGFISLLSGLGGFFIASLKSQQ